MIYIAWAWGMTIHHPKTFSFHMTHWAGNPLNWYWSGLKGEIQFKCEVGTVRNAIQRWKTLQYFCTFFASLLNKAKCNIVCLAKWMERERISDKKKVENCTTWIGSHIEWEKELQFPFQITFLGIRVPSRMIVYNASAYNVSLRPVFNYYTFYELRIVNFWHCCSSLQVYCSISVEKVHLFSS